MNALVEYCEIICCTQATLWRDTASYFQINLYATLHKVTFWQAWCRFLGCMLCTLHALLSLDVLLWLSDYVLACLLYFCPSFFSYLYICLFSPQNSADSFMFAYCNTCLVVQRFVVLDKVDVHVVDTKMKALLISCACNWSKVNSEPRCEMEAIER